MTLSCRFKLELTREQKRQLLETAVAYTEAASFVLEQKLKGKTTNIQKLRRLYYSVIRERFNLPAQLAINAEREAASIYQMLQVQYKELKRRKPNSKAAKKFWNRSPKRKPLIAKYTYNRTASFK